MGNQNPVEADLTEILEMYKRDIFLSLNCHAIATVQSFDADTQRVKATVNYKKVFEEKNRETGQYEEVLRDYPILMDCPVVILSGGTAFLSMPIAKGDECVILFNDRDMDDWLDSGQVVAPASERLHNYSDGIALIGLRSKPRKIADYDSTRARLQNGQVYVGVSPTLVKIGNQTDSLGVILTNLLTGLNTFATALGANGSPASVQSAGTALATVVATASTKIAGLLE